MFVVYYSPLHLFETVTSQCQLSCHSYLREVGGDGSVLVGVELETAIVQEGATPTRFYFWSLEVADSMVRSNESIYALQ
jgi:hypothetical protein